MLFARGFGDGASVRAMRTPEKEHHAYNLGYAAGQKARAQSCAQFSSEIGYVPAILRTAEAGKTSWTMEDTEALKQPAGEWAVGGFDQEEPLPLAARAAAEIERLEIRVYELEATQADYVLTTKSLIETYDLTESVLRDELAALQTAAAAVVQVAIVDENPDKMVCPEAFAVPLRKLWKLLKPIGGPK